MDNLVMGGASTRSCSINDSIQFTLPCGFCHSVQLENHSSYITLANLSNTTCNTRIRRSDNCSAKYHRSGRTLLQWYDTIAACWGRGTARTGINAILVWVLTSRNSCRYDHLCKRSTEKSEQFTSGQSITTLVLLCGWFAMLTRDFLGAVSIWPDKTRYSPVGS